ncbi:MAG TPA: hypothetical protein VLL05_18135 [Terriglobales bacterium]|nr:hypothetical protein [Terriglobales bacterium]
MNQFLCVLLLATSFPPSLFGQPASRVATPGPGRLEQLVEANIVGVHAYQILLARKQPNMDPACWRATDPKDADLESLVAHQTTLLGAPAAARAWALGAPSTFDPGKDLQPLLAAQLPTPENLPVNLFATYLHGKAPQFRREEIRSVANLYQTVLEVERDGDRLQDLSAFYIALGLPVYVGQLGLPGTDEDFLATGRVLEGHACTSPVGLSAAEWQIAGRKIWNWGEKNLHVRDAQVLADELLAEPDVKTLEPRMKALPAQRVAIIGHSFTMDLHWASPSAFVPIVTAMFARENPAVQFRQFQGGGLTSSRAMKNFYQDALAWKPDTVLLVLINRTDKDLEDLRTMGQGFKTAGARVVMFDDVHDPDSGDPKAREREASAAQQAGIEIAKVSTILAASPDRSRFSCLDHIHMTEPYHRLMAKEWLRVILKKPLTADGK